MTALWLSGARKLICQWIRRSRCNPDDTRRASSPGVALFSALAIACLALTFPNPSYADKALTAYQTYDAQLCRATIEVIASDVVRLNRGTASDAVNRGLERRLRTYAAPLLWLCRRAVGVLSSSERTALTTLQTAISTGQWSSAEHASASLRPKFPFDASRWTAGHASAQEIGQAQAVYDQYCDSCHRFNTGGENPAEPLDALRKRSGETNFVARLILGVHGTGANGYRNPLTPKDIRGLNALMAR